MAESESIKKINRVPSYTRLVKGKTVVVKAYERTNPNPGPGRKT